jgi:endogenous inhibitor of DNA gyrase (YacG/DUF329 family)
MNVNHKCPKCNTKTIYGQHSHFPFCSAKCKDSDFIDWNNNKNTLSTPITDADEALDYLDQQNQQN